MSSEIFVTWQASFQFVNTIVTAAIETPANTMVKLFSIAASLALLAPAVRAEGDPSILLAELGRASNDSLQWGPYKPNLYFGVRPKIPKSLAAGLMWVKADDYQDVQHSK